MRPEVSTEIKESMMKDHAKIYADRYEDYMVALEGSVLARVKGGIGPMDVYALGVQLEMWEKYYAMCEEDGNTNLLGKLPSVAMDVITAVQGVSIMPIIASVQPIQEEQGIVYFKNIRAETARGNMAAGERISDPRSLGKTPQDYSANCIENEVGDTTAAATLVYAFNLANAPIRSESLVITVQDDPATYARDVGPESVTTSNIGILLGVGLSGTVNYTTGAVSLTFAVQPAQPKAIYATYQENFELAADIPEIQMYMDSVAVKAKVWALKATIGMLQSYGARQRFGMSLEDDAAADLVAEINKEIGGSAIRKLYTGAVGLNTFSRTPPDPSISFFEHKQLYKDQLANAEATLGLNAGRGNVNVLVAGRTHAALISTLPGFTKISDGTTLGPHVYGTLDGITIIRVLEDAILGAENGVALWKGMSPFEAACVWAPYMPLVVTGTIPVSPNPLGNQRAAAVWAAQENLVPQYATRLNVLP